MRTHETKTRQYFRCTMGCSEVFSRQHDRMRHEVTKHGRECKWSCDQCRKFFSFERTLKNHKCSGDGFSRWSLPSAYLIYKTCGIQLIVFSFLSNGKRGVRITELIPNLFNLLTSPWQCNNNLLHVIPNIWIYIHRLYIHRYTLLNNPRHDLPTRLS